MNTDIQVERWPIERLIPRPNNPRTHNREQIRKIAASIREFGWTNPILVGAEDDIIAGHARLEAAQKLGMKEVPVIQLGHLSEAQRRALVIADNQLAIAGAGWDEELLRVELAALHVGDFNLDLIGFDDIDLQRLLEAQDAAPGLTDEDAVPDVQPDPVARLGDLFVLGKHRIICGDCTQQDVVARLLGDAHVGELRRQIRTDRVQMPQANELPGHPDTTYLSVVDRDLNAVSLINSIYMGFGSTIYAAGSGVLLHNRGAGFQLTAGHPNALAPGKRPMHTIIPGMALEQGRPVMPFGVMGGHYQATGHAQLISHILDRGFDVQQAIDAPRSFAFGGVLELEPRHGAAVGEELSALGHKLVWSDTPIGGGQAIFVDHARGVLIGGSDSRKDGCAFGY